MENMPYLVVAAGKESEENDCPLVRLSVQVAADWRVNIEERRGLVKLMNTAENKNSTRGWVGPRRNFLLT